MDSTLPKTQQAIPVVSSVADRELAHVTQEMYKKNFELEEKNKTLLLLRHLNEIILSSVTDTQQIAQQVADIVAKEAEFKAATIYLADKKTNALHCIATSQTTVVENIAQSINKPFFTPTILLSDTQNLIAKTVIEKTMQISHNLNELLLPYATQEEIEKIKGIAEIKSSLIYPLVVRDAAIGALIINLGENEETMYLYQHELVDRLSGVIGIAIDNALLYQNIQEANERLKSLDKLKDEFVSLASHELRTPMTAIKSYLWLVLQQKNDLGSLTEKQKVYLDRTYQSTERLIKLVNDMLNVSRIESGRMTINFQSVDMVKLANDVLTDVLPSAQNLSITVLVVTPNMPLPPVVADPEKIKQVLINLIGNSLKFTPAQGKITVSFTERDNMVLTYISDTGKGIKHEDVPKLFQKFGMIEGNYLSMPTSQGSGLGLYLTKSIIELHGGTVTVASEGENKGTTFTFSLKRAV